MKKMMGILLVFTLAVFLALPALAAGDESALEWGMTKDQVIAVMGVPDETSTIGETGMIELDYVNQPFSEYGYTCILALGIREDTLYFRMHLVENDADMAKYNVLKDAYIAEYGESDERSDLVLETFAFLNGVDYATMDEELKVVVKTNLSAIPYQTWKADDNTDIIMIFMDTRTGVLYLQSEGEPE